jgi:hypothetical protein
MRAFHILAVVVMSASVALGGEGPAKPPELKVLQRFVGAWDAETVSKPAVWTPKEVREKYVEVRELVVDGWFVEGKGRSADGKAALFSWMMTYDPTKKEYREWLFLAGGVSAEWSGPWDEAAKTFSLTGDAGGGITSKLTVRLIDKDRMEFSIVAKGRDGKLYQDGKGTLTRRVDKPRARPERADY